MSQKTTTSLRLTPFQIQALNDIAKKTGLEPSFLIRAAIDGLISHYDACGGKLTLPLDFSHIVQQIRTPVSFSRLNEEEPVPRSK